MGWIAFAAALCLGVGVAHSWLGERYILIRLFRRGELPKLFGSDWFTRRTLRFAWHLTTIAWWGLGGVLLALADPAVEPATTRRRALTIVAAAFLVHAVVAATASRGRHLAWIAFLAIAAITGWAALAGS